MTPGLPWHNLPTPLFDISQSKEESQLITKGALYDVRYQLYGVEQRFHGVYRKAIPAPEEPCIGYLVFTEVVEEGGGYRAERDINIPASYGIKLTKIADPPNANQRAEGLEARVR